MTILRLPVDVELLTVNYLFDHDDIDALVDGRVSTELPKTPTFPHLTVTRLGGRGDYPGWLNIAHLQIDAWAATKGSASLLARTALAVLREMPGLHELGVVTHVGEDLGLTWAPDELTNQPRYLFGVAVHSHPVTDSGS